MIRDAASPPVANATVDAVRQMLNDARPESLTLLDVRMDQEYAATHIPGARLLPLPELPDRLETLDRQQPIIVYCRSGKRSAAAAAILAGAGFAHVTNMLGGISAWHGATAHGSPDTGLTMLTGKETPEQILLTALGMEAALEKFYAALAATATASKDVLTRLAGFENKHLQHVYALYRKQTGQTTDLAALLADAAPEVEGGLPGQAFLDQLGNTPQTPQEALELAASVEAQAYDLYTRLARQAGTPEQAALATALAQEEKQHLRIVASLMAAPAATSDT